MKLLILFGEGAVGKMTVGQELAKISDFRLFYNHMTIEPVIEVFGYANWDLINKMRELVFEEFAASNNYGLIFTYLWIFNKKSNWDFIDHLTQIFKSKGADLYYVELVAPLEIRLQRNATENRLHHKPSLRDVETSNQMLINDDQFYRCVSNKGEIQFNNYIKIDNSHLSAENVAKRIKEHFSL